MSEIFRKYLKVEKNETGYSLILNRVSYSTMEFGVHGVSGIGILFNIVTIIVLATRFFDHSFYNFLLCRCVCNLVVCLMGIFFLELPVQQMTVEYLPLVFNWFVITLPLRAAFIASVISDNLLISNRLATLYKKNNSIFYTMPKKANLFICFSISITVAIPFYFAIQVVKCSDSPTETKGYWTLTEFGETSYLKMYALLLLLVENVIPLLSLIVMNIIAMVKFKRETDIVRSSDVRAQKANNRFTKLTIILTCICIVARILDTILSIYNRLRLFFGIVLSDDMEALLKLLRNLSYLLMFSEHALDGILYYIFDKKLNKFLKRDSTRA